VPLTSELLELGPERGKPIKGELFLKPVIRALREPRVWLPLVGVILVVFNLRLPQVLLDSLDLLGEPTTGLSLFLVGLIIAEEKVEFTLAVAADVLFKNLVHPAVMLVAVLAFGITGTLAREAVLLAAIPSAVITTVFAEEYGVLTSESSTTILVGRLLSFATIPLIITLMSHV
jgi:predicted permease